MSLIDALLEEGPDFEVWIANRGTSGPTGSGSQADPYNGATIPFPEVPVSQIAKGGLYSNFQATVTTAVAHPFANGDRITILGVNVGYDNLGDVFYTGTFEVYSVTDTSFVYTMLGEPTSTMAPGSAITCVREREQLDTLMSRMPEGIRVNIGPGVYETKGMAFNVITWQPKPGQTIRGSGVGLTTLRLVGAAIPEAGYLAVGVHYYTFAHDFTISDLTVDCNVSGQLNPFVMCGAISIQGSHIRISRIRVINFGSHTKSYVENFVIGTGATHPNLLDIGEEGFDCVIEDCIAERPSPNPINNSTVFVFDGGERLSDGAPSYHRGCVLRNCYVNLQIIYGTLTPVPIDTISYDGATVTLSTKAPHLLSFPGNVVVRGVTVNNLLGNLFNGVFAVKEILSTTSFSYGLLASGTPDPGIGFIGGGVPTSHAVSIGKIEPDDALDVCPSLALYSEEIYAVRSYKVTTLDPHFRTSNNNARITGVQKPDPKGPPGSYIDSASFNGSFAVDEYHAERPNEFFYTLLQDPDEEAGRLQVSGAFVGVGHQGLSAGDHGTAAVAENNRPSTAPPVGRTMTRGRHWTFSPGGIFTMTF
jgi:hypothetical protein